MRRFECETRAFNCADLKDISHIGIFYNYLRIFRCNRCFIVLKNNPHYFSNLSVTSPLTRTQSGAPLHNMHTHRLPNCFYWKASGQGHHKNFGVTVAPYITMVMPKQCLTAKLNTKRDIQLRPCSTSSTVSSFSHKKLICVCNILHRHPVTHDPV